MELSLTEKEVEILRETIKNRITEIGREIPRTDKRDMREGLKGNESLLESILAKLGEKRGRTAA